MSTTPPSTVPGLLLLTSDTVGGVWNYSLTLARALGRKGVNILLATMGAPLRDYQREELSALKHVHIIESQFKLEWMEDPWEDVEQAGEWLLEIEREFHPDLIHLNNYAHGVLPFEAPKLVVGHSCVLSWWRAVKGTEPPDHWKRYREYVAAGLHGADRVSCPTHAMLRSLIEHYGAIERCIVIPNSREFDLFSPGQKENLVFTAGRVWDEAKNTGALLAVAEQLPWPVVIAGANQHPDGGERACDGTRMLGQLNEEQVADWHRRASIYAAPARYEPFGLSIFEAALSQTALVLGDIPTLRELWDGAALFVAPDDHENLWHTIISLIENEPLRRDLGMRARDRASQWTPESMASAYLRLYRSLLQEKRAGAGLNTARMAS